MVEGLLKVTRGERILVDPHSSRSLLGCTCLLVRSVATSSERFLYDLSGLLLPPPPQGAADGLPQDLRVTTTISISAKLAFKIQHK